MDGPRAGGLNLAVSDPHADVAVDAIRFAEQGLERGAARTAVIEAGIVAMDPAAPGNAHDASCSCPGNLMAPPFAPSPGEFGRWLGAFQTAVLLEVEEPDPGRGPWVQGGEGWRCAWHRVRADRDRWPATKAAWSRLQQVTSWVERESMRRGYYLAVGFGAGDCELCEVCDTAQLCVEPYAARPSLEAVGVDVAATRAAAGWDEPALGQTTLTGLLLLV